MDEAIRLLRELRSASAVTEEQTMELLRLCCQSQVPCVTVYSAAEYEGWYRMQTAYIFTKRTDAHEHIWYFSPMSGLMTFDLKGENPVPFEQWDPEADLFTDDVLFSGATNIDPVRRERR